jgi:drug/metabolite transporter (DMT)-like permease
MALCALLWSTAGIFIKMIPWNPLVIAGGRSLIAAGVVLIYLMARGIRPVVNPRSLTSGALLSLTAITFVTANKLTTSANAIVLQFTAPVYIMAFSAAVYHQRFRRIDYLAVAATMGGIVMCFLDKMSAGGAAGNLIAVMTGVTYAGMYIANGHADVPTRMSGILWGHLMTAAVGLAAAVFAPPALSGKAVMSLLVLGVFQLGLSYVLFGIAIEHCPPLVACLVSVIEPLLNPVWVLIFDGEAPGPLALIGGLIAIAAITLWSAWDARAQSKASAQANPPAANG